MIQPKFLERGKFDVIGLKCITSLKNNQNKKDVPELWNKFMKSQQNIKNKLNKNVFYGICIEDKNNAEDFEYIAGVEVKDFKDQQKELVTKKVPASKYAVFTHKGDINEIEKTWDYIFGKWLPDSEIKLNQKGLNFELYDERYSDSKDSEVDIYIAIR